MKILQVWKFRSTDVSEASFPFSHFAQLPLIQITKKGKLIKFPESYLAASVFLDSNHFLPLHSSAVRIQGRLLWALSPCPSPASLAPPSQAQSCLPALNTCPPYLPLFSLSLLCSEHGTCRGTRDLGHACCSLCTCTSLLWALNPLSV